MLPVLQAVERAYSRAPSLMGVRTEAVVEELGNEADLYATALLLGDLVRADYLEETADFDHLPGPASCRLAEKGLQVTAGWPSGSGEVAFERLLAVIEERITTASSEDERTRWTKLRDEVVAVGRTVFVSVLTTAVNAAAKDLGNY